MKLMISACLLGENCKYNGGSNYHEAVVRLASGHRALRICPEVLGGLPVPRVPSEILDGKVVDRNGRSVDREFRRGAAKTLAIALRERPDLVILKSASPSCGVRERYDGTFSGRKIPGSGVTAELLMKNGFHVIDETDAAGLMAGPGGLSAMEHTDNEQG